MTMCHIDALWTKINVTSMTMCLDCHFLGAVLLPSLLHNNFDTDVSARYGAFKDASTRSSNNVATTTISTDGTADFN